MSRQPRGEVHTHLSIQVQHFDVSVTMGVNHRLLGSEAGWAEDTDRVYVPKTYLDIRGTAKYPEERAGEVFEVGIYGERDRRELTFKDIRAYSESGAPLYRKKRDMQLPVHEIPKGLTTLSKNRHLARWQTYLWMEQAVVSDMLQLLHGERPLYIAIHERKAERQRWVMYFQLQTTNPADE